MAIFKSFDYGKEEVTAIAIDENNGYFLWIAFKQDTDGNVAIKKVSAHDLGQTYFDVTLAVDEITRMVVSGSSLLVGVRHSTNYIYRFGLANPFTTPVAFALPSGVVEYPVDVVEGGSALWWLFPGDASGENAKIVKTDLTGNFDETIDLVQSGDAVLNARGITYKDGDLWVVTFTDPAELWRIRQNSGGFWVLDKNEIV